MKAIILWTLLGLGASAFGAIHGTWDITDFTQGEEPFCEGPNGKLIYEPNGGMSVAINCEDGQALFYSGTFATEGDVVTHHITNSNRVELVGKSVARKVDVLTASELVLSGNLPQGKVRIAWTREAEKKQSSQNVAYLTHLKLKPGTQAKFLEEVRKIVRFSRSEPGNIAWFVQQGMDDPTEVVFYTRWVDQAAIEWHLSAPPLKNYIEKSAALLSEPAKLKRYRPLDLTE